MATGSISTLGVGSGLELQSILDQLREVDQDQTITPLESDVTDLEAQLEEFTVVKNMLLDIKSNALTLSLSSTFFGSRTVTSSDEDVFTATVTETAAVQSTSIEITKLARKNSWASDGFSSADASINVPISQYSSSGLDNTSDILISASESLTVNFGTSTTLTLNGSKSLADVVIDINNSSLDVTATAEQIDGKYYLYVVSDTATNSEDYRVDITSTENVFFQDDPPVPMSHFSTTGVEDKDNDTFLAANASFVINYGSGSPQSTYTVEGGASGKSLQDVVDDIDGVSGITAAVKTINGINYLHISSEEVAGASYQVTIDENSNTSGISFQQGDPDDTFYYTVNDTSKTLVYVAKDTSLSGLVDLINNDTNNAGITASAVDNGDDSGTPYQLVLESNNTGEDGRISLVSQLFLSMTEKQGAAADSLNAAFKINEIDYQRQSNTVSDIITGVTLTLKNTGSDVTVTVAKDDSVLSSLVEDLVTAYNDAVREIETNTAYDEETEEFGILAGTTLRDLSFGLQNLLVTSITGSDDLITYTVNDDGTVTKTDNNIYTMFDLGLEFNQDGTITIDSTVLADAISSKSEGFQHFFLGDTDEDIEGFADQLNDYLRTLTGGTGQIEAEKSAAQTRIDNLELEVELKTERLNKKYDILTKQFIGLDRYMSQMTSLSNYLTSQFDSLSQLLSTGK